MLGVTLRTASFQPPVRRVGLCVGSLRSVLRTSPRGLPLLSLTQGVLQAILWFAAHSKTITFRQSQKKYQIIPQKHNILL
jgi:hypothetical protein